MQFLGSKSSFVYRCPKKGQFCIHGVPRKDSFVYMVSQERTVLYTWCPKKGQFRKVWNNIRIRNLLLHYLPIFFYKTNKKREIFFIFLAHHLAKPFCQNKGSFQVLYPMCSVSFTVHLQLFTNNDILEFTYNNQICSTLSV